MVMKFILRSPFSEKTQLTKKGGAKTVKEKGDLYEKNSLQFQ